MRVYGSNVIITDTSTGKKGGIINNTKSGSYAAALVATAQALTDTTGAPTSLKIEEGVRIEMPNTTSGNSIVVYATNKTYKTEAVINNAAVKGGKYAVSQSTGSYSTCTINGGSFESSYSSAISGGAGLKINGGIYSKLILSVMKYVPEQKYILIHANGNVEIVNNADDYPAHLVCTSPGNSNEGVFNRMYAESDIYPLMSYASVNKIVINKDASVTYPDNTYFGYVSGTPSKTNFEINNGAKLTGRMPLATAVVNVTGNGTVAEGVFTAASEDYAMSNNGTGGVYECSIAEDKRAVTITLEDGTVYAYRESDAASSINNRLTSITQPATIDLLKNYTASATCCLKTDTTINLNGNTYTYTGTSTPRNGAFGVEGSKITLMINAGTINGQTIKGGTIKGTNPSAVSLLYTHKKRASESKILIGEDVNLIGNTILIEGNNNSLEFNGNISTVDAKTTAIMGNGDTAKECDITIGEKAVIDAGNCTAIFNPQSGTLTVNGGSITGGTAIHMKSGNLIVNGGTITATGAAAEYTPTGDGTNPTGDAILLDACGYPGGAPSASITGGTITATGEGTKAVACYRKDETVADIEDKNFITGGTFSNDITEYLETGLDAVQTPDGNYTVADKAPTATWATDTDAGYYLEGETKYGLMRFLFKAAIDGTVSDSGIKYIKGSDLTDRVYADGGTGTSSSFFGDVNNIPETASGTYYAVAYIVADGVTYWSEPVGCSPDFSRHFTSLDKTEGGAN